MAAPVVSASITTVIAFSALVVIGGRFGALIAAIPFVVSAVIIASLIESFLILPHHMKQSLSAKNQTPWYDAPSRAFNRGFAWFRDTIFRPFMAWVVRLRYLTLSLAIAALLYSVGLFASGSVKWEFFSRPEQGTISANVIMDAAATRADTKAMLDEMNRALNVVNKRYEEEHGTAPLDFSQATLGDNVGWRFSAGDNKPKDLLGGFQAALIDADLRPYSSFKFMADWDSEINASPLVESLSLRSARGGPGGDAIDVKFTGADAFTLKAAAETLKAGLADVPGVSGLDDTLVYDKTELILTLTPRGEAMGFTARSLGAELRGRLNGIEAAEFAKDARQVTVRVQPPEGEIGADYLEAAHIRAPSGAILTIGEIASISTRDGFAAIKRENGLRVATVTGEVDEDLPGATAAVREALEERILPAIAAEFGVAYEQGGLREQESDFLSDALTGFFLALAGIYLTLTWVFASWSRPMVVMLVIPFGFIGAVWGHYWFGLSLSMFSIVGLIGMAGIIINDSIVLVTTIDEQTEKRGMIPSIVDGTTARLRAVVLTTLTTVGGLAPLLFETSRQALFLKPTVVTLSFGLGFGVILVLLVTPAVMAVEHDIRMAIKSLRHAIALPGRNRRQRERFGRYTGAPKAAPRPFGSTPRKHPIPTAQPEPSREAASRAAE
jgi:multidrug efflux pump subunit AcrB